MAGKDVGGTRWCRCLSNENMLVSGYRFSLPANLEKLPERKESVSVVNFVS
jgi:hypothetical protein